MKNYLVIIPIIFIMTSACNSQKNKSTEGWNENELNEWFNKGKWKQGWNARPDESVNRKEFARYYHQNPKRWNKAFEFLNGQDLTTIKPGRYELEGADLFVNVDEYVSKNEEEALLEAHQKYADIQYVVSGEEKIGIIPLNKTTVTTPYDPGKDVVFLDTDSIIYRKATPEKFFIFFPDDAHRPGVKINENIQVIKVVAKVRIK